MNHPIWDPFFYHRSPAFKDLLPFWQGIENKFSEAWPTVEDFNQIENKMHFVLQKEGMQYIWEIYKNNVIPMRCENWHDFFNNLTWLIWPKLKKAITIRMCQEVSQQGRTPLQNSLAHFDENGAILCYDDPVFVEYIKEFQWKKLFWETENLSQHLQCMVMGHGLFEKLLFPFLGITAKAIFLKVPSAYFFWSHPDQLAYVDDQIADYILSEHFPRVPRALQPFPLLGWPNWYEGNREESFYDNQQYFRPKRQLNITIPNNHLR